MKLLLTILLVSQTITAQNPNKQKKQNSFVEQQTREIAKNSIVSRGRTTKKTMDTETNRGFLQNFIGNWKGEGKIAGLKSKIVMKWESVLAGKFIKLTFRNEMQRRDGGKQMFEGNAFYKAVDTQRFAGHWFDSGGESLPIDARIEGNSLNSLWGTENAKLGRTIYRLTEKNKMEVIDSIRLKNGTWREFGRSVYTRQ